jgi:hypothetical protein
MYQNLFYIDIIRNWVVGRAMAAALAFTIQKLPLFPTIATRRRNKKRM